MYRKTNIRHLITLISLFVACTSFAQISNSVSGQVINNEGEKLAGALVWIDESQKSTVCDSEGYFEIRNISRQKYTLKISFLGYADKSIRVHGSKNMVICMEQNENLLKEVVCSSNINALSIRERSGVVDKVNMQLLKDKPMIDIALALQGSVPGLTVTPTGILGEKPEIRIRGNSSLRRGDVANEPLYVMDGKIISSQAFMLINPMDIKEIKILKDAAACAIYGIKAANGVIEISSNKGFTSDTYISYSSDFGIAFRGTRGIKMMKSKEKLQFERKIEAPNAPGYLLSDEYRKLYIERNKLQDLNDVYKKYFGTEKNMTEEELAKFSNKKLKELENINTDWFDELLRNTFYHNHHLSMRGGSDKTSYSCSLSYTNQEGQLPGNKYDKLGVSFSFDRNFDKLIISTEMSGGFGRKKTPEGGNFDIESLIYNLNPYETRNSKLLFSYPGMGYKDLFNQFKKDESDISTNISLSANWRPVSSLEIGCVTGISMINSKSHRVTPSTSYNETKSGVPEEQRGFIKNTKDNNADITFNLRATYNKIFLSKHDLTLSANYDYYYTYSNILTILGYGTGTLDFMDAVNNGIEGYRKPYFRNNIFKSAQLGYGVASGYSYDSKIDLFATFKRDASSLLSKKYRWNTSWAVGGGIHWNKFFKSDIITDLSTRISYGFISNLSGIQMSETIPTFSYTDKYYDISRSLKMNSMYNPLLRPEKTTSTDIGLSIGIHNKHSIQIQWYKRYIGDAILSISTESSMGSTSKKENIGILQNKGIEIQGNTSLYQKNDINITLMGNIAYNNNLVISLYDKKAIYSGESIIPDFEEGRPYNLLWGWESVGVNPLTGAPHFRNKDGKTLSINKRFNRNDLVILGRSTPPLTGSIGISVYTKNFDADMRFYYTFGGYKGTDFTYIRNKDNSNKNAPAGLLERTWFESGDENRIYPNPNLAIEAYNNYITYPNSRMIVSTSFIKLSSFVIKYKIPRKILAAYSKNLIKYWSFSVKGSNLFILTPYTNGSPESVSTNLATQPIITISTTITF